MLQIQAVQRQESLSFPYGGGRQEDVDSMHVALLRTSSPALSNRGFHQITGTKRVAGGAGAWLTHTPKLTSADWQVEAFWSHYSP